MHPRATCGILDSETRRDMATPVPGARWARLGEALLRAEQRLFAAPPPPSRLGGDGRQKREEKAQTTSNTGVNPRRLVRGATPARLGSGRESSSAWEGRAGRGG